MNLLLHYLNQPFPYIGYTWKKTILLISLYVSLLLLLFQPLVIDIPYKNFHLAGYGVVSFIVAGILHIICLNLFPAIFNEDSWTIKKHMIWFFFQLLFIGLALHYYALSYLPDHPGGYRGILLFESRAFIVGVFPFILNIVITYNIQLSKNLKETAEINLRLAQPLIASSQLDDEVCLFSESDKEFVRFRITDLFYIRSEGNYIQVYYTQNDKLQNYLLRSSLKKVESTLEKYSDIIKCHRCYLINANKVSHILGNSVGYRIQMEFSNSGIPVSRNYAKIVKEYIHTLHKS